MTRLPFGSREKQIYNSSKKIENQKDLGLYLSHQIVDTFEFSNFDTYSGLISGGNTADTSEMTSENTLRIFLKKT